MSGGIDMNAGTSSTVHIIAGLGAAGPRLANELHYINDREGPRKPAEGPVAVRRVIQSHRSFIPSALL